MLKDQLHEHYVYAEPKPVDTVEGGRDESCGCDESLRVTPHLALTSHRHEIRQLKLLIIVIMIHYRLRLI